MCKRLRSWGPTGHPGCHEAPSSAAVTGDTVPVKPGIVVVVGAGGSVVVGVVEVGAPPAPVAWGELWASAAHDARDRAETRRATATMADPGAPRRRGRSTGTDATEDRTTTGATAHS